MPDDEVEMRIEYGPTVAPSLDEVLRAMRHWHGLLCALATNAAPGKRTRIEVTRLDFAGNVVTLRARIRITTRTPRPSLRELKQAALLAATDAPTGGGNDADN